MIRQIVIAAVLVFGLAAGSARPVAGQAATGATSTQVNLNTATASELERLPGVGPAMVARILEYRQKHGGFKKVEDLMNIQGIGEKRFLELRAQIVVTPPKAAQ